MSTPREPEADEKFSSAMKRATWQDHTAAEYTAYMQALLDGRLIRDDYADMVAQHYFAYQVIEAAAEKLKNDPIAGKFVSDGLSRVPALEEDLAFLLGADWCDKIEPNEGTKQYVARLHEVCFDWPGGFVAHHYTRYLGDLSGGQVIRAAAERAYDLPDKRGVQFYVFPKIPDKKAFKIAYRDALDQAHWDDAERARIIDEVIKAYHLNTQVLVECGRNSMTFQGS
ncbi:MAG TPA: biliverdin-producing heme oxygenase [Candidatus Nanopelagicales bacterium]|jgi:heme oxygenase